MLPQENRKRQLLTSYSRVANRRTITSTSYSERVQEKRRFCRLHAFPKRIADTQPVVKDHVDIGDLVVKSLQCIITATLCPVAQMYV
jgi:hypothetical protein